VPVTLTVTVSDPDADSLTVQFYGRESQPGACCTAGDVCVSVTAAACAAQGGAFKGEGVACTTGLCDTPPPGEQFSLVLLPDTQFYTAETNGGTMAMYTAQTQWVVNNRASRNIAAVAHLGDVTDDDTAVQWQRAETAMALIEDPATTGLADGIPYIMNVGNHDDNSGSTAPFNQWFGVNRFSGRSYYGGHNGFNNDDSYILFSGAGLDFVLISLRSYQWDPAVLTWADGVLQAYPARLGIVVSHWMLDDNPAYPGGSPALWMSRGQAIYDALKYRPNLILMACGHMAGEGWRTDIYDGRPVTTMLSDYQGWSNGGSGYLRILEFVPASSIVRVRTYSPWLNQYWADADSSSQFTLYDVPLGGSPQPRAAPASSRAALAEYALLGTVAGAPSGSNATFEWGGLDPETQYEWYVKVNDGHTSRTGSPWSFTTEDTVTSTLLSLVSATAEDGQVHLEWYATGDGLSQATLYRRSADSDWAPLAILFVGGTGRLLYEDREVEAGSSYGYRLGIVEDGAELFLGETWVEVPGRFAFALEGARPNPACAGLSVAFTLASTAPATLDVVDLGGRRIISRAVGSLGAGRHLVRLDEGSAVAPGLYLVRLTQGGQSLIRKACVVR